MKELTKAEEQVMQIIWKLEKAFLKEIVDEFPEPKPAYTTISTVIRVLVKKEFLSFETFGKTHQYSPAISKEDYFKQHFNGVLKNFFSGSVKSFASFFTNDSDMDLNELEDIRNEIDKKIQELKKNDE